MTDEVMNDADVKKVENEINTLEKKESENKELSTKLSQLEADRKAILEAKESEIAKLKEAMGSQETTFKEYLENLSKKYDELSSKWDDFIPERKGVTNTSGTNPLNQTTEADERIKPFLAGDKDPRDWHKDKVVADRVKQEFVEMLNQGRSIKYDIGY